MPPRPTGGRGRKAGLAIAGVLVVMALAVGGVYLKNVLEDKEKRTEVTSQLVLPVTTGDFRIAKPAQPVTEFDQSRLDQVGLRDPQGTTGTYYAGITAEEVARGDLSKLGTREVTSMGVFGAWGQVADPEAAVDALMTYGIEQGRRTSGIDLTLVGAPEPMQPSGLNGAVMKSQYAQTAGIRIPVCAWADKATIGFVTIQRQNGKGPVDLPLYVAADHTAALRTASLVQTSVTTGG